ncbi:MAG: transcriptional repressor LexA [Deltaproteobacteria bacterium]|nr:transcriptional repressor LexA [Deltaproteobacteria bacterium]
MMVNYKTVKLTAKQRGLLKFLQKYVESQLKPPSLREIANFLNVKHLSTAHFHLKALEKKGLIKLGRSALEIPGETRAGVKFFGFISAGKPLMSADYETEIDVPTFFLMGLDPSQVFIVQAKGNSMIEENIMDGDYLIVKSTTEPVDGETVIALLENECTVKKFYRYKDKVVLKPANREVESIIVSGERLQNLAVQGVVIGLFRRYNVKR